MAPAAAAARKSSLEYRMKALLDVLLGVLLAVSLQRAIPGVDDSFVASRRDNVQDRRRRYPAILSADVRTRCRRRRPRLNV
jgi:hypothetical protein